MARGVEGGSIREAIRFAETGKNTLVGKRAVFDVVVEKIDFMSKRIGVVKTFVIEGESHAVRTANAFEQ